VLACLVSASDGLDSLLEAAEKLLREAGESLTSASG
jgi:anaerobic C4-dicarboxylate transporter